MKHLIVSATSIEIEPLTRELGQGEKIVPHITRYRNGDHTIDVLITGVGMVATSYLMTKALMLCSYDATINAGICGSFNTSLEIGEVVHVISDSFPELGAESAEKFLPLADLNLLNPNEFPYKEGILVNTNPYDCEVCTGLKSVNGATVNTIRGNWDSILQRKERVRADVESMEGGAFFFVSLLEKTPCIQLRAVSNYVEPRNPSQWNVPLAIRNLNLVLVKLLLNKAT